MMIVIVSEVLSGREDREMPDWMPIALLHNLSMSSAIENDFLTLAPLTDERVSNCARKVPNFRKVIDRFTDHFKRKVSPSIIMLRDDAPDSIRNRDAIVAFRNCIAVSSIIQNCQDLLVYGRQGTVFKYSDYFTIYPTFLSKDYKYLISSSPCWLGLDEVKDFRGQSSPELAVSNFSSIDYDSHLLAALFKRWDRRYLNGKEREWKTRVLFRSLEVAFQASVIPFQNQSTIYDYGSGIALWVSAFEVLSHPKTEPVSLVKVIELMGGLSFSSKALNQRKYRIRIRRKRVGVNLAEKLYHQLHSARNAILHGNPVRQIDLFPFKKSDRFALNFFAPILFKVALAQFLKLYDSGSLDRPSRLSMTGYRSLQDLEEGLLAALKKRKR